MPPNLERIPILIMKRFNHKYNASPITINGIRFDSRGEARRYNQLTLMEKAGKICELKLQPSFVLQKGFKDKNSQNIRPIKYIADFQYTETSSGKNVVEDYKGVETESFKIKRKMFLFHYPALELRIIK